MLSLQINSYNYFSSIFYILKYNFYEIWLWILEKFLHNFENLNVHVAVVTVKMIICTITK